MIKTLTTALAVTIAATAANAATITVSSFSVADYNAEVGSGGSAVVENFESFTEGNVDNGFSTNVGTFATTGGTGGGGTISQADFANDGSKLALRDGNVYGRTSTTKLLSGFAGDDMFLDSNDTFGINWTAALSNGSLFNRIVLTLTDATDVGAFMTVSAGGYETTFSGKGNANKQLIVIDFGEAVQSASILFENTNSGGNNLLNDGFSIDDIAVSPVPLPASVLLMLAGLGGLGVAKRRRQKA